MGTLPATGHEKSQVLSPVSVTRSAHAAWANKPATKSSHSWANAEHCRGRDREEAMEDRRGAVLRRPLASVGIEGIDVID